MTEQGSAKVKRMYVFDRLTLFLLRRLAERFYGGNNSAALTAAVRDLARKHGLPGVPRGDEEEAPRLSLAEVFAQIAAWGVTRFGETRFEARSFQDAASDTVVWQFVFSRPAYEQGGEPAPAPETK